MKTYEQMAKDVLHRRNESLAAQAKKNSVARRVALAASICIVTLGVTAGVFGGLILNRPDHPADPNGPVLEIPTNPSEDTTNPSESTTTPPENTVIPPVITITPPASGVLWDDLRERNENHYMSTENWIEWGWEEMTDTERYTEMEFDGKTYSMMGTVKNYLGEWLASGEAYGYDFNEGNTRHSSPCEIYALTFSPTHHVVAVQFTGQSEVYRYEWKKPYDPPATFGELLSDYNLPLSEMISLTSPGYQTADTSWPSKYALSDADSDAIWEILKECENAPLNRNYNYRYNARTDISFSITSEILGIQGRPFVVNQDGYILANLEQYAYKFYIGADTAQEIIDYVLTHMTGPVPPAQPYEIVGVVTEIGDGYIKVDDSIMMKDPSEGLVFTITTEKKQLSRVVKHLLQVGSHVAVSYDGRVNEENPLLVETATNIQVVEIDTEGGGYIIPE